MEKTSLSAYLYGKNILLLPVICIDNGPLKLSEPIIVLKNSSVGEKLIDELILFRKNWDTLKEEYRPGYKTLLKVSGARSQKNLVSKGKLLSIRYDDSSLSLKLMKSNPSKKSFYSETSEPDVIIEDYLNHQNDVITKVKCLLAIDN